VYDAPAIRSLTTVGHRGDAARRGGGGRNGGLTPALEGWSPFDAFYMTITTITTIGGGEPRPMDVPGKWWTIGVVVFGFGALTYTVLQLFGYVIEGQLGADVSQRRMRRRVAKMRDHFILCGFGRVGREIARDFTTEHIPFVVVDINPESLQRARPRGSP